MNHHHYFLHHGVGFDVMGMSLWAITAALVLGTERSFVDFTQIFLLGSNKNMFSETM